MSASATPEYFGDVTSVIAQSGVSPSDLEGIDTQAELETFIEARLAGASSEIEEFCNRSFREPVEHTDRRRGNDSDRLQLRHGPVTEVVSIEGGEKSLDTDTVEIVKRAGFQGRNTAILKRIENPVPGTNLWHESRLYEITYMAGWEEPPGVVPSVAEDMTIAGIREAIGSNAYAEKGAGSVSMDGFSVTYDVPSALRSGDISQEQYRRLEKLKQVAVA